MHCHQTRERKKKEEEAKKEKEEGRAHDIKLSTIVHICSAAAAQRITAAGSSKRDREHIDPPLGLHLTS